MDYMHPWRDIRPWKRHSLALLVAGGVYIVLGFAYISTGLTPESAAGLHLALEWTTIDTWGYIFVLAGIMAVVSSRWPPISETWGYTVLTTLSVGWSMFYLAGIVFFEAPAVNWRGVITFGLLGFLWWVIAGLQNPGDLEALVAKCEACQKENDALLARIAELDQREG